MRTISSSAALKLATKIATEPLFVIKIEWSSGTVYYSEKALTSPVTAKGMIVSHSNIVSNIQQTSSMDVNTCNIVLADTDGTLKTINDTLVMQQTLCTIYQAYADLTSGDMITLMKGYISGDIVYSDKEQTLTFDVESVLHNNEIGYSLPESAITNQNPGATGAVWPLCFGTVLAVPAVKVIQLHRTTLTDTFYFNSTDNVANFFFKVSSLQDFPIATTISVDCCNVRFTGKFDSTGKFTYTTGNVLKYSNVTLAARKSGDADLNNASVFWISNESINIAHNFVYLQHSTYGYTYGYVYQQIGSKCYLSWPATFVTVSNGVYTARQVTLTGSQFLREVRGLANDTWNPITLNSNLVYAGVNTTIPLSQLEISSYNWTPNGSGTAIGCSLPSGGSVIYVDNNVIETYVCNGIVSSEVFEVCAYGTADFSTVLDPNFNSSNFVSDVISLPRTIPSNLYYVNVNDTINGQTCTTIKFYVPLSIAIKTYLQSDAIYVSLVSSVSNNPASIIKWVIDNYTSLSVDATSYATMIANGSAVSKQPANFAIFSNKKALDFIKEIAWQARLAVIVQANVLYFSYISQSASALGTLTASDILEDTLNYKCTPLEDVYTKITATWRQYYLPDFQQTYYYKNNASVYNLNELQIDFYIYTDIQLVHMAAAFWGYRYSNVWRKLTFKLPLHLLKYQLLDLIQITLTKFSSNTVKAFIINSSYSMEDCTVELEILTASKTGGGAAITDTNFFTGDPAYPTSATLTLTDPRNLKVGGLYPLIR